MKIGKQKSGFIHLLTCNDRICSIEK